MKDKMYVCPHLDCRKAYSAQVNLKRHVECIHLRLRSFVCYFCSRQLSSQQNFREHLCIHTGEKPFRCKACGAAFRQGSQFSQHKKKHRRQKAAVRPWTDPSLNPKLTFLTNFSSDHFFNPAAPIPPYKSPAGALPVHLSDLNFKPSTPNSLQKPVKLIL